MRIDAGKDGAKRIRVGIIGANPDRGWAAQAHIPALTSLSDDFEITALSTSRRESADAGSKLFGVPAAFDNHQELVNSPAVDVVAVTVKVPHHLELASAAIDAGKAVYCEWPLGNGLKEAETLAALGARVLDVELPVPHAHTRFEEGELIDEETRAGLADALEALAEEVRQRERAKVVA